MLEKMQGARILILHDTGVKGYCTKPLNQLQFLYWGRSRVAPDVRIPFQMERLKRLEMCILRAAEIDLTIKVRWSAFLNPVPSQGMRRNALVRKFTCTCFLGMKICCVFCSFLHS
jgi:hypothetical protein